MFVKTIVNKNLDEPLEIAIVHEDVYTYVRNFIHLITVDISNSQTEVSLHAIGRRVQTMVINRADLIKEDIAEIIEYNVAIMQSKEATKH